VGRARLLSDVAFTLFLSFIYLQLPMSPLSLQLTPTTSRRPSSVTNSTTGAPVGTVLLSLTTSTLFDKSETVDLELPLDEFMKFKNKLQDASRDMRLA
jgi:hypothetical protein